MREDYGTLMEESGDSSERCVLVRNALKPPLQYCKTLHLSENKLRACFMLTTASTLKNPYMPYYNNI